MITVHTDGHIISIDQSFLKWITNQPGSTLWKQMDDEDTFNYAHNPLIS